VNSKLTIDLTATEKKGKRRGGEKKEKKKKEGKRNRFPLSPD
jgi:hypothetical protein